MKLFHLITFVFIEECWRDNKVLSIFKQIESIWIQIVNSPLPYTTCNSELCPVTSFPVQVSKSSSQTMNTWNYHVTTPVFFLRKISNTIFSLPHSIQCMILSGHDHCCPSIQWLTLSSSVWLIHKTANKIDAQTHINAIALLLAFGSTLDWDFTRKFHLVLSKILVLALTNEIWETSWGLYSIVVKSIGERGKI